MDLIYLALATAFWVLVFGLAKECARLLAARSQ
jgi:hypothetical protein